MNNYSAPKAIVLSSFLFAAFHLNIYQFVSGFIGGCLLGWIYVKSRSLWPCILYHALFNSTAFIAWAYNGGNNESLVNPVFNSAGQNILALIMLGAGVFWISKILSPGNEAVD
jgi:hypothetical protein